MEASQQLFVYKEKEVELPSGYLDKDGKLQKTVIVREMSGEEEDLILDKEEAEKATLVTTLLNKLCKLKDSPSIKFVQDLLLVDQYFLLIQIRMLTYGNDMRFEVTCREPNCARISNIKMELDSLKFVGAPDPMSLEASVELPSGVSVKFKKAQGKDNANVSLIGKGKGKDKLSQLMQYKIIEMHKDGQSIPKTAVKSLPAMDRKILREAMRKAEGDAETVIDVDCFHCGKSMKVELPFDQSFFCLTGEDS